MKQKLVLIMEVKTWVKYYLKFSTITVDKPGKNYNLFEVFKPKKERKHDICLFVRTAVRKIYDRNS